MEHSNRLGSAAVAQVDAAGRRWYTAQFKREVVARCLAPGASVSKLSIDLGINTNLIRKWIRHAERDAAMAVPKMLPVTVHEDLEQPDTPDAKSAQVSVEIRIGDAVIAIAESASPAQIGAIVRALR